MVVQNLYDSLDPKKSPGSPLVFVHTTNGSVDFSLFSVALQSRFSKYLQLAPLVMSHYNDRSSTLFNPTLSDHASISTYFLQAGISDPVLLKTKSEMRKVGKEVRLVCMVSCIDNSIARLLLGDYMEEENDRSDSPTATRLNLSSNDSRQEMYELFAKHPSLLGNDVRGWEYANNATTHFWPFIKWTHVLGLKPSDTLFQLLLVYYVVTLYKVVQLETGELVTIKPGVVTSGGLTTYSDNSCKRSALEAKISLCHEEQVTFVEAAGDDCLSTANPHSSTFHMYGFEITDEEICTPETGYSFCSTRFTKNGSYQENIDKMFTKMVSDYLTNLSEVEDLDLFYEQVSSFNTCFENHPNYRTYVGLLDVLLTCKA